MSGAARRVVLLAFVAFGMTETARGQSNDRLVIEGDLLEMEIVRRSDGGVLDSSTALVRRGEVFPAGIDERMNVTGQTVEEIEAAIAGRLAKQKQYHEKVDIRVRILESRGDQVHRVLFSDAGEGIEGRSLRPIAAGPKSSIAIIYPPDILKITAIRRSDRFELITGGHLARPDGTVGLGIYGNVDVAGLTVPAARRVITKQLGRHGYAARDIDVTVEIVPYRKVR